MALGVYPQIESSFKQMVGLTSDLFSLKTIKKSLFKIFGNKQTKRRTQYYFRLGKEHTLTTHTLLS